MSESKVHFNLVRAIVTWIQKKYGKNVFSILMDSFGTENNQKTFPIGGYYPDVYACDFKHRKKIILGEAKTMKDIESRHSELQIISFLKYCSNFEDSLFVVSVPWDCMVYTKKFLNEIQRQSECSDVKTLVINELS